MRKNELLRSYGTEYRGMTVRLLKEAGLFEDICRKADCRDRKLPEDFRIGIKPNLVSPTPADFGGTTHPEIVAGILDYLLGKGIKTGQICILEGSWVGDKTSEAFDYCGYLSLQREFGVSLIDLQKEKSIDKVDCAGMELFICRKARELDYLINVPVLKGHCQTRVTCALKNMKGVLPNSEKRRFHQMGLHRPIAHLNTGIHQDFIVIDHICGDPDFEEGGNPMIRNCIMTALDPVLIDAYTCKVLGYEITDVPYIGLAEKLGVGSADLSGLILKTVEGIRHAGEPLDTDASGETDRDGASSPDLTSDDAAGLLPETRRLIDVSDAVTEVDSCSACFGTLVPALEQLKQEGRFEELLEKLNGEKIGIGQGWRGKKGRIGIGNCTAGFEFCIHGCPPRETEIYDGLIRYLEG